MVGTEHSKCFDLKGRAGSTPAAGTRQPGKTGNMWVTGFDLARKTKQQSVVVGSTLKADKKINAETEIAAAMANFDAEIAMILDAELATV